MKGSVPSVPITDVTARGSRFDPRTRQDRVFMPRRLRLLRFHAIAPQRHQAYLTTRLPEWDASTISRITSGSAGGHRLRTTQSSSLHSSFLAQALPALQGERVPLRWKADGKRASIGTVTMPSTRDRAMVCHGGSQAVQSTKDMVSLQRHSHASEYYQNKSLTKGGSSGYGTELPPPMVLVPWRARISTGAGTVPRTRNRSGVQ
jgi:hypothetical protein